MRVLITGGGGFIGSHLVEKQLGHGHQVRTVDRNLSRLAHLAGHPRLEMLSADITSPELPALLARGVDVVYHLAAAHLQRGLPESHYVAVNVAATERLLTAARSAGVGRVVHCSSVGVYGPLAHVPADEGTPCHPVHAYGRTKLAGERAALRIGQQTGLSVVVARPAWVYGPGCPRTRKLFQAVRRRRFVLVGDGRTLRQPLHVADAVQGLELCAESAGVEQQVYLLAGSVRVTIAELASLIARAVGVPTPRWRVPARPVCTAVTLVERIWSMTGREPPLSRRSLEFFLEDNAYDTSKAERDLGFVPRTELVNGLTETWATLLDERATVRRAPAPLSEEGTA
jgi:dihydroflavonol-4-reductase